MALASIGVAAVWKEKVPEGKTLWLFAAPHRLMYEPIVERWNQERPTEKVAMAQLSLPALERRMLASFFSGTPSADLLEAERRVASRAFTGPLSAVGFIDLTDRIERDGIRKLISPAAFSPWTTRGRVFGLPHDVHPVMLGYRADLVEAAGIDVSKIETWDDFVRLTRPLMAERDGNGRPKRFVLNMWPTDKDHLEVLLLQAGGGFFDESEKVVIDSEVNAKVLATICSWCAGPDRMAAEAPNFTGGGNQLKLEGFVAFSFFPDWMGDVWKHEIPQLEGKMKLMPLPAWEKGGRRTSVWGGTMLGIPKTAAPDEKSFEERWSFAKHLYLSRELAVDLYRRGGIITPVTSFWSDPVFDEPSVYFSGQAPGRMYIDLALQVPARTSSAFNNVALLRVQDALVQLSEEAARTGKTEFAQLKARAGELLKVAHAQVQEQIDRNVFLAEEALAK